MSELNKLRWRCRRGTLEMDLLLLRYLENHYLSAETNEQQAFLQLLELEDTELMRYLMGEETPVNSELLAVVAAIRALPAS